MKLRAKDVNLAPRQYEAALKYFGERKTLKEIAEEMGICFQAVSKLIGKARRVHPNLRTRRRHLPYGKAA